MWSFNVSRLQMILHRLEWLVLSLACSSNEQCIPCGRNVQAPALNPPQPAACAVPAGWRLRQEMDSFLQPRLCRGHGAGPRLCLPRAQSNLNIPSSCILEGNSCGSWTGVQCLPFPEAQNVITSTGITLLFVKDMCVIFCHK